MSLLSDSILVERFSHEIKQTNAVTQRAFHALLDSYVPYVNLHAIADTFMTQAMARFQKRATIEMTAADDYAACSLVFLLDPFFTRPPAATASITQPYLFYIYQQRTRTLLRTTFDSEKVTITKDEEDGLLQLLQEPGSQMALFQKALQSAFPSIRIQWRIARDIPRYHDGSPFLYYGDHRDGLAPFWFLEGRLEFPVMTAALCRTIREHAVSVPKAGTATATAAGAAQAQTQHYEPEYGDE
jgi:hypothetical protein